MALARRLVELGRSARSAASTRTRQPLSRALVGAAGFAALPLALRELVAEELNVRAVDALDTVGGELVTYTVKPEFRALGKRFGSATQAVAAAIRAADPVTLARAVAAPGAGTSAGEGEGEGVASVEVPSLGTVALTAADLVVTQTPLEGWGVATAGGETVALDLSVTPVLRAEGLAREVVRLIQDARKSDGLEVSDRIVVRWAASDPDLAAALTTHGELIAGEVLAVSFGPGEGAGWVDGAPATWHEHADADLGLRFLLAVSA
jgi:isoleucyl-tRNA synthetase